jgi:peroxiredoxin
MANNLTGDFDVVAEFAILAVDRLLAGMHQTGRFLHSMSVRVDDNPQPNKPGLPVVVGTVDAFGAAVANQRRIGISNPSPGPSSATSAAVLTLLNADELVAEEPEIVPSHISGVAQLQLFPPTIAVPDASGTNLTIRMNLMARFFPDKGTAPLAEFVRGDLQITAPINKIASGSVNVLDIDFRADEATINFTPSYSSTALTAEDLAGISLCIQNGLRTSFLPSSVTLPNTIAEVQLKTLPGAVVLMLDLTDHPSTSGSVTNVFLASDDDFAFAVGRDYLLNVLRMISDNILSQTFPPVTFTVDLTLWGIGEVLHYSYPIKLSSASFDLQTGKIVLTINGHAGPEPNGHPPSSFNFTVTVEFSLATSGPSVELIVGNVSVSTDSTLAGIVDFFTGDVTNSVKSAIATAIANTGAGNTVSNMFDANTNLGNFLNTQLNPPTGSLNQAQQLFLVYTSVDIQPAGVVLHGSLLLFDWPDPYVEFEAIPPATIVQQTVVSGGTDYSALKTWIPGGTVGQYQWHRSGQPPFDVDPNRFVLLSSNQLANAPGAATARTEVAVLGYSALCLTITGTRISNYGSPATYQQVTASICAYTSFPVVSVGGLISSGSVSAPPTLAVTHAGLNGEVVVSSHVAADVDATGLAAPNLLVHFSDSTSSSQLETLTKAVARSHRKDSPTGVIAVLTPEHLSKAKFTAGVVYAEDTDGSWERFFGVGSAKRPLTLIVSPRGSVSWQSDGPLHLESLAAALGRVLVKRPPVRVSLPSLNVRIGQLAPNFLFEYSSGHEMPFSKLSGQSRVLVFWRSAVKPSIQAVREMQNSAAKSKTVVLAVNDGDDPATARAVAAENGLTAILVTDPKREISRGYGVSSWPTIVSVNPAGVISGIRYGRSPSAPIVPVIKKSGTQ